MGPGGRRLDLILQAAWGQGTLGEVEVPGPERVSGHTCLYDDVEGPCRQCPQCWFSTQQSTGNTQNLHKHCQGFLGSLACTSHLHVSPLRTMLASLLTGLPPTPHVLYLWLSIPPPAGLNPRLSVLLWMSPPLALFPAGNLSRTAASQQAWEML